MNVSLNRNKTVTSACNAMLGHAKAAPMRAALTAKTVSRKSKTRKKNTQPVGKEEQGEPGQLLTQDGQDVQGQVLQGEDLARRLKQGVTVQHVAHRVEFPPIPSAVAGCEQREPCDLTAMDHAEAETPVSRREVLETTQTVVQPWTEEQLS